MVGGDGFSNRLAPRSPLLGEPLQDLGNVSEWRPDLDRPNEPVPAQDHAACSLDASHVLTAEEIPTLTAEPGKPAETLMNVVALIARRFGTDVCSAYLLEPDRANLVLAATLGLDRKCIGKLRMDVHEGLVGLVAEQV